MEKETEESTIACVEEKAEQGFNKVTGFLLDYKCTLTDLMEKIPRCTTEMTTIADELDKFHRGATIASVTGSSVGIAGGITIIVGLALAPVTLGASLIVSGVGIGVAIAGGLTGAGATIADTINIKMKCKRVQEMIDQIQEKMKSLKKKFEDIKSEVANIKGILDPRLIARGVLSSVQISRLIQLGSITTVASRGAQVAAKGVQVAAAVSGVVAALVIIVDAVFVIKGAIHLHKGSKTEEAAKIRKQAEELNIIYQEFEEVNNLSCEEFFSKF